LSPRSAVTSRVSQAWSPIGGITASKPESVDESVGDRRVNEENAF